MRVGFASAIAAEVRRQLDDLAVRKGATLDELERGKRRLTEEEALRQWTEPVAESDADAYAWEVRAPLDSNHPRLKFVMRQDAQAHAWIATLLDGGQAAPPAGIPAPGLAPPPLGGPGFPPPPVQTEQQYHLAINGQTYGPYPTSQMLKMLQERQLDPQTTQIWRQGFAAWMPLAQCNELMPPAAAMPPPIN